MGVVFQITDDLLDVTSTAEKTGKAVGKDADMGKQTLVTLLGLDGARAEAEKRARRAVEALGPYAAKAPELSALPFFLSGPRRLATTGRWTETGRKAKIAGFLPRVRVPFSFRALDRRHKEISMNRILKSVSLGLMLAAAPALTVISTQPVQAQAADPAVAQVQGFYDALTGLDEIGRHRQVAL